MPMNFFLGPIRPNTFANFYAKPRAAALGQKVQRFDPPLGTLANRDL